MTLTAMNRTLTTTTMRNWAVRFVPGTALIAILALTVLTIRRSSGGEPSFDGAFQAFLRQVDAAQLELQNGKPAAFKALWSQADDATLSGGFGGTIEQGWEQISRRLDWVGAQFSKGTNRIERVVAKSNGGLGYVVQLEHLRFVVPGQARESTRDYRVTMLFRREPEGWRIIHRQADSQMLKEAPR